MVPKLVTTLNERPGMSLLKVWPCGQRCQFAYDDMPTRHTMVGDVGAVQVSELHGSRSLVPGETYKKDAIPIVCS